MIDGGGRPPATKVVSSFRSESLGRLGSAALGGLFRSSGGAAVDQRPGGMLASRPTRKHPPATGARSLGARMRKSGLAAVSTTIGENHSGCRRLAKTSFRD